MSQSLVAGDQLANSTNRVKPGDTGTLGKAMDVLKIVANANGAIRFTEILELSSQPRGTLHRQLSNLVEEGLLSSNPDHSYELGIGLLKFASKAWSGNEFRKIAEPHLHELRNQTGETVHLGILKDAQVIYLDKVEAQHSVRMYSQVGNASPVYCTGVGKAALSGFPDSRIETIMKPVTFKKFTENTITTIPALLDEIKTIRQTGNAWDREEHEAGIHCVAAPIHSRNMHIAAGISVTGPSYRVSTKDLQKWSGNVRETAKRIMADMSIRLSPRM